MQRFCAMLKLLFYSMNMSVPKILKAFKKYQNLSDNKREVYLKSFEEKMIYRTTKTENPEVTLPLVKRILSKYKSL